MLNQLLYEEKDLLIRLSKGETDAFDALYNRHWNRVYKLSLAYLQSTTLAQDAVQDVFLKIWSKRAEMGDIKNFESFLLVVCRNHLISAFRKRVKNELTASRSVVETVEARDRHPHDLIDQKETNELINRVINGLPSQQQKIFMMSRHNGLTHEEIAFKLGIKKQTVKNHMVRAIHTLKNVFYAAHKL